MQQPEISIHPLIGRLPFSDRSAASFHTAFGHSQVSFTITEKTTTAIVGPSGAGKTTMWIRWHGLGE